MTQEQIQALRRIAESIIDACKAAGPIGAPGGILYASLMSAGCSLHQFEQIMSGLVRAGKLTRSGECYHFKEALQRRS